MCLCVAECVYVEVCLCLCVPVDLCMSVSLWCTYIDWDCVGLFGSMCVCVCVRLYVRVYFVSIYVCL